MSLPSIFSTSNSIFPSSINIVVPGSTSLYKSLYVIDVFVLSPIISSFTNVNVSSAFKVTGFSSNFPVLISGPCVSKSIATGKPTSALACFILL